MEDALKERAKLLGAIVPDLFKAKEPPTESLIQRICIHRVIAETPVKITAPKKIKVKTESVFEEFSPQINVVAGTQIRKMCPLTMADISVPWVGQCGHVFETSALLAVIKTNPYCPVLGCNKRLSKQVEGANPNTQP